MESILNPLTALYPPTDPTEPHLISLSHASRLYKLLLQGGHYSQENRAVKLSSSFSNWEFARRFIDIVGKENTVALALGEGAFVAAALCGTIIRAENDNDLRETLKSWFDEGVREQLGSEGEYKGRSVLIEQVVAL